MRNETLIKVIIAVFAIILIVMGTFAYGNLQRSKQDKNQASNQQNTPSPSTNQSGTSANEAPKTNTPPQTSTPPPVSQPAPPVAAKKANIPSTGGELSAIPMTILSVLGYEWYRSRKRLVSRSQR